MNETNSKVFKNFTVWLIIRAILFLLITQATFWFWVIFISPYPEQVKMVSPTELIIFVFVGLQFLFSTEVDENESKEMVEQKTD